jgi:hypothetical protein
VDGIGRSAISLRGVPGARVAPTPSVSDYPGVTAFARVASESPAARRERGNRAGRRSLRVAHAAADTALDALKRSQFNSGDGAGLRGGRFHAEFADAETITLTGARWAADVTVDGTLHWSFDDGALDADLEVDGPGRRDGTLHLRGGWLVPGSGRALAITGTLGGRRVVARMPSS